MKKNKLTIEVIMSKPKAFVEDYIRLLPSMLLGSGTAFLIDLSIYTCLRPRFGANISALTAFFFGTITLYSILRLTQKSKIRSKRIGVTIQLVLGVGSLAINLIILNSIDFLMLTYYQQLYLEKLDHSSSYAAISKLISATFGFLWTSSMSSKILFRSTSRFTKKL